MTLLEDISTEELIEELRCRNNVEILDIDSNDEYFISSIDMREDIEDIGPAKILIVKDKC